ncbi:MAG: hypothetical protein NVSMB16_00820 [Acidimicrobiales bacterium]
MDSRRAGTTLREVTFGGWDRAYEPSVSTQAVFPSDGHRSTSDGHREWPAVVERDRMLVGAFPGVAFSTQSLRLSDGDALILSTDGVIESRAPEDGGVHEFGIGRLCKALSGCGTGSAQGLIDAVDSAMTVFTGGAQADDVAMLAFVATGAR